MGNEGGSDGGAGKGVSHEGHEGCGGERRLVALLRVADEGRDRPVAQHQAGPVEIGRIAEPVEHVGRQLVRRIDARRRRHQHWRKRSGAGNMIHALVPQLAGRDAIPTAGTQAKQRWGDGCTRRVDG